MVVPCGGRTSQGRRAATRVLVTGSAGHLGDGLIRTLQLRGDDVVGLDLLASPSTTHVGSITDTDAVRASMDGVDVVMHAATLHKPHVATHPPRAFVHTNVAGTLAVLEAARDVGVRGVVFTSTTSAFGAALQPAGDAPAAWITEDVTPVPRNIYGVTKCAAEDLCELAWRSDGLPVIVLRTSRFFPERDDDPGYRHGLADDNLKVNELLFRRLDLSDAVSAHLAAADQLGAVGFGRYVVSATTPFAPEHLRRLRSDAPGVIRDLFGEIDDVYGPLGWRLPATVDRVYVNRRARDELGWRPTFDFRHALDRLRQGRPTTSELARTVGSKGYHRPAQPAAR